MKRLIKALLRHNHEVTGLPMPKDAPSIRFTSYTWLSRMTEFKADGVNFVSACYDPNKGIIWLSHAWDKSDPYDVAILAHELVHHMQWKSGKYTSKRGQWKGNFERDAYRSQFAYAFKHGVGTTDWYKEQ